MNQDEETLLAIKGTIFDLPASDQQKVKECAKQIKATIAESGTHGLLAFAWVGAELQLETS